MGSRVTLTDEYVRRAKESVDSGELQSAEIDYKLKLGCEFAAAREAVLNEAEDWIDRLKVGLAPQKGHPMTWQMTDNLKKWGARSPDAVLKALQALWTKNDLPVAERIRAFSDQLPQSVISGPGTRMRAISTLLMGLDAKQYPPFAITLFDAAYTWTGYDQPQQNADEAALYEHALGFLDRFIEEAEARGLRLRHRLDAQSVVWHFRHELDELSKPKKTEIKLPKPDPRPVDLKALAGELFLPVDFLKRIESLLEDKKQIIFQGPPGTGKTYVARALAQCLAGSEGQVTLVQFHPSYAYEDFVRGFRPTLVNGQAGFELRDGPLLQAAEQARTDPDAEHYLVIDEINRGNLAKVFGELYFLLEYRDEKIRLQYQKEGEEDFSLPKNLYIIGTMNTADRSIALVDLALRRRFYFVEFHPDKKPVKNVLRRWLREKAPGMEWVAACVDLANEGLSDDRHAAIGPSYFMKDGLDEADVRRIWKHSVLPYIEERLFGDDDRLGEFDLDTLLDTLRKQASGGAESEGQ